MTTVETNRNHLSERYSVKLLAPCAYLMRSWATLEKFKKSCSTHRQLGISSSVVRVSPMETRHARKYRRHDHAGAVFHWSRLHRMSEQPETRNITFKFRREVKTWHCLNFRVCSLDFLLLMFTSCVWTGTIERRKESNAGWHG